MHHVQLIDGKPAQDQVDPGVHAHLGQNGDPLCLRQSVELRQGPGVAGADKRDTSSDRGPGDARLKVRRQHADHHLRSGLPHQLLQKFRLRRIQRRDPHFPVALLRDVSPGHVGLDVRGHDLCHNRAVFEVMDDGLALKAEAQNECFH